jgi:hypothetical protein
MLCPHVLHNFVRLADNKLETIGRNEVVAYFARLSRYFPDERRTICRHIQYSGQDLTSDPPEERGGIATLPRLPVGITAEFLSCLLLYWLTVQP